MLKAAVRTKGNISMKGVGAVQKSFMLQEKNLHTRWFPRLKFEGKWCFIKDDSAPVGIMEALTKSDALKLAKETMEQLETK